MECVYEKRENKEEKEEDDDKIDLREKLGRKLI